VFLVFELRVPMLRIVGMVADITERKPAEEALVNMTRKLVDAQEKERRWTAREHHVYKNSGNRRLRFQMMCKPCRTICTPHNWNIQVSGIKGLVQGILRAAGNPD
jgi:hypothetical protein